MANTDVTRIAGNIGALNALNSLQNINKQLSIHQTRLSTGKRINSAADDPAGLTIATKMLARSEGMKVVVDNISDASNMLSVAESGLGKMNDILVQMRNKAEQAASDTLGSSERQAIQVQLSSYAEQLDSIVNETKWNNSALLDGTADKTFQTGVDESENTTWALATKHDAVSLNVSTKVALDNVSGQVVDASVASISSNGVKFSNLSKASTGDYILKTVGNAATSTVGKIENSVTAFTNGTLKAGTVNTVTNGIAAEVNNGTNTFEITGSTAAGAADGTISFKLNGTQYTNVAVDKGTGAGDTSSVDVDLGGGLTLTIANREAAVSFGSRSVDYIQSNTNKYALQRADGSAVGVDNNGTDETGTNATATSFYAKAGADYDTGLGITIKAGTLASGTSATAPLSSTFNFAQQSNYSVDVSTAAKAASYMTSTNTAIGTVNNSLVSLGSMMARLNYKSDAVATAQINVESSYNRIMNANMAEEQMNASKYSILQQTAVSMLAQANQAPQTLLSLFR
jgi:flagellin